MKSPIHLGCNGRITSVEVLNPRKGLWERRHDAVNNLLLDQGLDAIADNSICDIFNTAVKGTGTDVTTEEPDAGTHAYTWNTTTLTRTAGTRDFTAGDVGKLIKFTQGSTVRISKIVSYSSATVVTMALSGSSVAGGDIIFYDVEQVGMDTEPEHTVLGVALTKTSGSSTVTAAGAAFAASDVGRAIYFPTSEVTYVIAAYTSSTSVDVEVTEDADIAAEADCILFTVNSIVTGETVAASRAKTYSLTSGECGTTYSVETISGDHFGKKVFKRTFIFAPESAATPTVLTACTYTHNGTTVTRTSGAVDFTSNDVGKVISFSNDVEAKITAFTSATIVTVDVTQSPSETGLTGSLYPYSTYTEVGFSHIPVPGDNLNIRALLAAGVKVVSPTANYPGEQLKVTYEFTLRVSADRVSFNLGVGSNRITDPNNVMSSNKQGFAGIESMATSNVETDGETDLTSTTLEPYDAGQLAFSQDSTAIGNVTPNWTLTEPDRSDTAVSVQLTAAAYSAGSFLRDYEGTFQTNDAVGTAWRSLMLYNDANSAAILTYLFNNVQRKNADNILRIVFRKTWDRDLIN